MKIIENQHSPSFSLDFSLVGLHHESAMDADERDICIYLRSWVGQFVSQVEIARRAGGKRRYREDPTWAVQVLGRLLEKGLVEADSTGHYRLKPRPKKENRQKWVSPQVRAILEKSGKKFEEVLRVDEDDEFLQE